ncbi:MAG: signal peptidase II [Candidatus Omnitrophica bacterium]|nr:signal peptidase II [Candidatus Omnitrophota bacterium]
MIVRASQKAINAAYVFLISSSIFVFDRIIKAFVCERLSEAQSIKVIPGIFHITLVFNKGAAFGILKDQRLFFVLLSIAVISLIVVYLWRNNLKDYILFLALALLLGGACGNLLDRVRFGYVIDFLDFRIWPVFNVADSSITIGAVILAFKFILTK